MGWVRSANRLANKPYRQSAGFLQNANLFLETKKRQFLDFQTENRTKLTLFLAPRTGFEPAAYRLGGGRSIHLSYRGLLTCVSLLERCAIRIKGEKRMNLCVLRRRTLYPTELSGRIVTTPLLYPIFPLLSMRHKKKFKTARISFVPTVAINTEQGYNNKPCL